MRRDQGLLPLCRWRNHGKSRGRKAAGATSIRSDLVLMKRMLIATLALQSATLASMFATWSGLGDVYGHLVQVLSRMLS